MFKVSRVLVVAIKGFVNVLFKLIPSDVAFPIMKGPLKGSRWISGAASGKAKGLSVLLNRYEKEQINQAMKFLNRDAVCFDVGANVGIYTLLFARYSKRVYAFEPLPRNISYLERTIEINKITNAYVVPMAMADITGVMFFQESVNNTMGKLSTNGKLGVNAITCDDFVSDHEAPSLIKIDVEGAEYAVLQGAKNTLQNYGSTVLLSTHSNKLKNDCLDFLERIGYTVYQIKDVPEFLAVANRKNKLIRAEVLRQFPTVNNE